MRRVVSLTVFLSILVLGLATVATAQVPNQMQYQGYLTDDGGAPLDTTMDMVFVIYDDSIGFGSIWTETHLDVTVEDGLFEVILGSVSGVTQDVVSDSVRWLGITVGDDSEIYPRTKLVTVPYAFRVSTVDGATGGTISGDVVIQSDLDLDGDLRVTGKATIGEGHINTGSYSFVVGYGNTASDDYATVSGGEVNNADGYASTVGGGWQNFADSIASTIAGGSMNWAIGGGATVAGGVNNHAVAQGAAVGGGLGNEATYPYATVAGGSSNAAHGDRATVAGGHINEASGARSTVGGGDRNTASGDYSIVGGGSRNHVASNYSAIIGGYGDTITAAADYSYLFGTNSKLTQSSTFMVDMPHIRFGDETDGYEFPGEDGTAGQVMATDGSGQLSWADMSGGNGGKWSVIDSVLYTNNNWGIARGGVGNVLYGDQSHTMVNLGGYICTTGTSGENQLFSTVGGGRGNVAGSSAATVSGGYQNKARGGSSTVGGGYDNVASGNFSTVGGGVSDTASAASATVGGGISNVASGVGALVGGGSESRAEGSYSTVGGGGENFVAGDYSAILGGRRDTITSSADYSYLFGIGSKLTEDSTFMVDMPHIRFGDEASGYEFPPEDGSGGQVMSTDGSGRLNWIDPSGSFGNWSVTDSVLYTNDLWGIARGGADNVLYGDSAWTMVNLGMVCTTGTNGGNYSASTVSGGIENSAVGPNGTVGGGRRNRAAGPGATVGGGCFNTAGLGKATVGGGTNNVASGEMSTVCGGGYNHARGNFSVVAGGGGSWPDPSDSNSATGDYSTVSGGSGNMATEDYATVAGGRHNVASGDSSTVSGGSRNEASGEGAYVGGGAHNRAAGMLATVGGGSQNIGEAWWSTISGGYENEARDSAATVSGGQRNTASGQRSAVGGGWLNTASNPYSTVGGGLQNASSGFGSTVGGGGGNDASGERSTVAGGGHNTAKASRSTVGGGWDNYVEGYCSSILGGYADTITASGDYSYLFGVGSKLTQDSTFMVDMPHIRFGDEASGYEFPTTDGSSGQVMATDGSGQLGWADVSGDGGKWSVMDSVLYTNGRWGIARGYFNALYGDERHTMINLGVQCTTGTSGENYLYCTVTGGRLNVASGNRSTVGGGIQNVASGWDATISGGNSNTASGAWYATIGGGYGNTAAYDRTTVGGGYQNSAIAYGTTISGGELNAVTGVGGTVGGGDHNFASGKSSTVPGGSSNLAAGDYSFAAGRGAYVDTTHHGTFIWAGGHTAGFASTGPDQFLIRASGGVGIGTNSPGTRALDVLEDSSGTFEQMVNFERTHDPAILNDMLQIKVPSTAPGSFQFIECERGSDVEFKVEGDGDIYADGSLYGPADFAEMLKVSSGASTTEPGDVMVIDPSNPRAILKASRPRSTLVAGIYSTKPGFVGSERDWDKPTGGEEMGTYTLSDVAAEFNEIPLAIVGIVPCKVSAENGPIRPGDLLVTSGTPGCAMRDDNPKVGTVVGKALEVFPSGTGVIKVLVTLH